MKKIRRGPAVSSTRLLGDLASLLGQATGYCVHYAEYLGPHKSHAVLLKFDDMKTASDCYHKLGEILKPEHVAQPKQPRARTPGTTR